jgi:D-alanine-D-alanine ligase
MGNSAENGVIVVLHSAVAENAGKDEQDTLAQARAVARALKENGRRAVLVPWDMDLERLGSALRAHAPAAVFNLVEGVDGSSRLIFLAPLLLERHGIPFTGCGSKALYLTTDKVLAKRLLAGAALPTPEWITEGDEHGKFSSNARYIIKPIDEDASLGIHPDSVRTFSSIEELRRVLAERALKSGGGWFAEQFIAAREFNISVLEVPGEGPRVLPAAEINYTDFFEGRPRIIDYRAKWDEGSPEYKNSLPTFDLPRTSDDLVAALGEISLRCWRLFGLRGYARVDFRVDDSEAPYVLEVNCDPGITPGSGFVLAAARGGVDYLDLIRMIIGDAPQLGNRGASPITRAVRRRVC